MIKRRRDYGKKEPNRDAHKIYIICEGKGTEPDYFSFFESFSSNLEIITIPPTKGTDAIKLMKKAKEELLGETRTFTVEYEHGDTVWFIFDTDMNEAEGKIAPLRYFCEDMNSHITENLDEVKPYRAWNIAQSDPSFEIWLYYHFYSELPDNDEVNEHASFKEYVNGKINGGFKFHSDPVRLEDAIANASLHLTKTKEGKLMGYATEMPILGKEILGFTKVELDKLLNKLI